MAYLINRTTTGRIVSLHAEVKYLKEKFGSGDFTLNQMKFDGTSGVNQLDFFLLTKHHEEIGKYDPYLKNPLSKAGFHLTQSIQYDAQKSKSVSECMNALEALGWAERTEKGKNRLTKTGIKVASLDYASEVFLKTLRDSLLGYGVFLGFLFLCYQNLLITEDKKILKDKIWIGYPNTNEFLINTDGRKIPLSLGSEKDSMVRTKGILFAWAITGGFLWPDAFSVPSKDEWLTKSLEIIRKKKWVWKKFISFIPKNIFDGKRIVNQPLTYVSMTKSTKALRERGQEEIRESSMMVEEKVKNRRFAIIYLLGLCAKNGNKLNYQKFIGELLNKSKQFVINSKDFSRVMELEKNIAITAGIPFKKKNNLLEPLSKINMSKITENAPSHILNILNNIFPNVKE